MPQTPYNAPVAYSKYNHLTNTGTAVCKSAPGMLGRIVINACSGASTITLYDNTVASGTVIGVIALLGVIPSSDAAVLTGIFSKAIAAAAVPGATPPFSR